MVEGLQKGIEASIAQSEGDTSDLKQLLPVVQRIITPDLLKTKVEKLLDDKTSE
jgi:hypothetical protein